MSRQPHAQDGSVGFIGFGDSGVGGDVNASAVALLSFLLLLNMMQVM